MAHTLIANAGIDNVFDKNYVEHLSGIDRVSGSDAPLGQRIPGYGRNYYASLQFSYD